MKTFKDLIISFHLEPPTYTETTKIISKMKSFVSRCPLDQVSVIAFKKCLLLFSLIKKIIILQNLYSNYISILMDSFMTSPIRVYRGVLQGDSLSPLLFNNIINTLYNTIKYEKIECMGYFFKPKTLVPVCR